MAQITTFETIHDKSVAVDCKLLKIEPCELMHNIMVMKVPILMTFNSGHYLLVSKEPLMI